MTKKLFSKMALIVLAVFFSSVTQAKEPLVVIYDSGDGLPISDYFPTKENPPREPSIVQQPAPQKKPRLPFQLPITTESMQPGLVEVAPKALHYLQRPLFLVGSDEFSKSWLRDRREQLLKIGAVGLLIEAKDSNDVDTMRTLAEGLQLIPASAQGFANDLGLSHYPVLLSKQGWEQ